MHLGFGILVVVVEKDDPLEAKLNGESALAGECPPFFANGAEKGFGILVPTSVDPFEASAIRHGRHLKVPSILSKQIKQAPCILPSVGNRVRLPLLSALELGVL